MRYKALIIHRINGYIAILLLLISHIGAVMVVRHSFGGEIETQALIGVLVIITTLGAAMAYYNIKRLQIEQHRAWMIRTWFYAASIITLRIIMAISSLVISNVVSTSWSPLIILFLSQSASCFKRLGKPVLAPVAYFLALYSILLDGC